MPVEIGGLTLYTVQDITEVMSVSDGTIRKYIREGILPARKIGRRWYISEENIRAYFSGEKQGDLPSLPPSDPVESQQTVSAQIPEPTPTDAEEKLSDVENLITRMKDLKHQATRLENQYLAPDPPE